MSFNNSSTVIEPTDAVKAATKASIIAQTAFLIVVFFVTLVGNSLVVIAVVLFRRLRSMTHFFVVSLAVSDILVALITLTMRIDQTFNGTLRFGINACRLWIFTDVVCSAASMWNLAIISIDRYLAIHYPFTYFKKMTHKVGFSLIGFVWLYALLWASLAFVKWDPRIEGPHILLNPVNGQCANSDTIYYTTAATAVFFLPLVTVIFAYGKVFAVALRHAKAMAAQRVTGDNKRALVHELKATKVLAIVVGAFVVCWLPFWIVILISLWKSEVLANLQARHSGWHLFIQTTFIYFLPVINSTLNPAIYGIFNKDFRAAYKRILYSIWKEKTFGELRPRNRSMGETAHFNVSNDHDKNEVKPRKKHRPDEEIGLKTQNNNFA